MTYLSVVALSKVLHLGHVDELDGAARNRGSGMTNGTVAGNVERHRSHALRLPVCLDYLSTKGRGRRSFKRTRLEKWASVEEGVRTMQPRAQRVKVSTSGASGADETISSLMLPPMLACTLLKISLSQMLSLRTTPLQRNAICHGWFLLSMEHSKAMARTCGFRPI